MEIWTRYIVACVHANKIDPIVYFVDAVNETEALLKFMSWHEKMYSSRRAYNVHVYRAF